MTARSKVSRLRPDREGGIEGLPLQLLIMVVVAGLGLTIIMGWMNSIAAPNAIGEIFVSPGEIIVFDVDGDGLYTSYDNTISVIVTDQSGDRLEGATVMLDGANIRNADGSPVRGVTDSNGQVVFLGLKLEKFGSGFTTVTVTVAKGNYGVDTGYEIPVITG
ncbi:MAG: carboxypeptidase-like regulatory domain-containing protein [Candidatus Thermoplasmatota archaeon]|nr:carboxypeptidase-like regulatory domain-containing protein [Candidatus Thermoplasmatota archaeon]